MDNNEPTISFLSGNPSDQEIVAVTMAVTTWKAQIVEKAGENSVETVDMWGVSRIFSNSNMLKNAALAGNTGNWQKLNRIKSRS